MGWLEVGPDGLRDLFLWFYVPLFHYKLRFRHGRNYLSLFLCLLMWYFFLCLLTATLELLGKHWALEVLSSPNSFWKRGLEAPPTSNLTVDHQPGCPELSCWVESSLNPCITLPSIAIKSNTCLAWINPHCWCLGMCFIFVQWTWTPNAVSGDPVTLVDTGWSTCLQCHWPLVCQPLMVVSDIPEYVESH